MHPLYFLRVFIIGLPTQALSWPATVTDFHFSRNQFDSLPRPILPFSESPPLFLAITTAVLQTVMPLGATKSCAELE